VLRSEGPQATATLVASSNRTRLQVRRMRIKPETIPPEGNSKIATAAYGSTWISRVVSLNGPGTTLPSASSSCNCTS